VLPGAELAQGAGQRLQQERVAAGAGVARLAQRRVRAPAQPVTQQRLGRRAAERPKPQRGAARAGPQFIEDDGLVRAIARGEQQRDRQALDAGGQVREPPQRRLVRPVRVVHHDQQRIAGRQVRHQPVEAVRRRMRDVVPDRAGLGSAEHPRRQPGGPVQQLVPFARPGPRPGRLEQLAGDPVAEATFQGQPARGQDPQARRGRTGARRPQQRRLADPGRPFDQHEGAAARSGGRCGRGERRQFIVAFEDHRVSVPHQSPVLEPGTARSA